MGSSWGWGSHAAGVGRHRWRDLQGGWSTGVVKNPPANAGDAGDAGSIPGSGRSPGGGNGNPLQHSFFFFSTPIFLPGESHGQRSLAGLSPWSHKGSDMAEVT